jgi:hypothetical protein
MAEAPLKHAVWRSKIVIFHTCTTLFFEIFLLSRAGLAVLICTLFDGGVSQYV